jgi:magnesium chelatase family protein
LGGPTGESTADVRERVLVARDRQLHRQDGVLNARLDGDRLFAVGQADAQAEALLQHALRRLEVSARSGVGVLRVARSIADLAGDERIRRPHVAEALQFRATATHGL